MLFPIPFRTDQTRKAIAVNSLLSQLQLAPLKGVVGSGNGVVYLTSPGRPTEIGLQLGKACYPCSR